MANFLDFVPVDGPRLVLSVTRERNESDDGVPVAFPRHAVEQAAMQMQAWVVSRLLRHAHETGSSPWGLRVTVHMDFGLATTVDDGLDDLVIDWRRDWGAEDSTGRLSRYSPDAMEAVRERMLAWVHTRLAATVVTAVADGVMPQEMRLTVDAEPRSPERQQD